MENKEIFSTLINSIDNELKYYRDRVAWVIHYSLLLIVAVVYVNYNEEFTFNVGCRSLILSLIISVSALYYKAPIEKRQKRCVNL